MGESNNSIEPRSLYYAQLKERLGAVVDARVQVMPMESEASSSPTVAVAQQLTAQAVAPAKTLLEFIGEAIKRQPLLTDGAGVRRIDDIGVETCCDAYVECTAAIGKWQAGARYGVGSWHA